MVQCNCKCQFARARTRHRLMKLRFVVVCSLLALSLPACPPLVRAVHAQSPLAKLTKVQQKVEVSSGKGASFRAITQGASIGRGSVVRTGRRSKADVKFSDGSLVRLGQLSSIEVRGPRNVQVGSGQALISWLSPGQNWHELRRRRNQRHHRQHQRDRRRHDFYALRGRDRNRDQYRQPAGTEAGNRSFRASRRHVVGIAHCRADFLRAGRFAHRTVGFA